MRTLVLLALMALAAQPAQAQERRRMAGGPGGPVLQYQPGNPDFPFTGSWRGTLTRTGVGSFPVGVNIDVDNGKYSGVSSNSPGQQTALRNSVVEAKTMRWEEDSALGVLLYTAKLVSMDSISGTVTLRDARAGDPQAAQGTFTLRRAQPPAERRND